MNSPVERALALARGSKGIFIHHTPERARAEASSGSQGLLAGVPYVVKDVFDVVGTPTTAGSRSQDGSPVATKDAEVVSRLSAAGAVLVGKVTLSELAYSGLGINNRFGTPTRTIEDTPRLSGGSSSGSAAAVASGIVPFALGTDTSGSTRVPAAWSGVLGYKSSEGRYSKSGLFALAPTLDTVGIFARDAGMLRRVDAALRQGDQVPTFQSPHTLVVPEGTLIDGCAPDVRDGFQKVIALLREHGWNVESRRLASVDATRALLDGSPHIVDIEAAERFGHLLGMPGLLEEFTARRLTRAVKASKGLSSVEMVDAISALRSEFTAELDGRILLTPAVSIPSPALSAVADPAEEDALNGLALRISMTLSYLGSPGITIPCPLGGTTFGALLSAAPGQDDALIGLLARAWDALDTNASLHQFPGGRSVDGDPAPSIQITTNQVKGKQ